MINLVSLVGQMDPHFFDFHLPELRFFVRVSDLFSSVRQMESQILYFYLPEPLKKLQ